jgi:hypothetical protein
MAVTQNTYTGNGSTTLYSLSFPYLEQAHVKVTINGTLTTAFVFANDTTIQFLSAPANGAAILIYRSTDDADLNNTFFAGTSIKAQDLNDNFLQSLYISQETATLASNQATAGLQAQITAATNTANNASTTATSAATDASTALGVANAAVSTSLQKAGDTITGNINNTATGYFDLPVGTTAQRPGSPNLGMIRFNSDLTAYEGYNGSGWTSIGGGAKGGGTDDCFYENSQNITSSYTITAGKNAMSAGPVTIQTGAVVTVPSGSVWSIV